MRPASRAPSSRPLGGTGPSYTPRKEVILVASDPLVLSAGGTTLDASHTTGAWIGETAWGLPYGDPGSPFQASGGGFSHLFGRPSYQNGVHGIGAMRGVPDVAADANPHTGFPVVTSNAGGGYTISGHGGTSASAPTLGRDHRPRRPVRQAPPRLRQPGHLPDRPQSAATTRPSTTSPPAHNTAEFPHGTITGYRAGPGWDPVTGWGSPNAQVLVPLLAAYARR